MHNSINKQNKVTSKTQIYNNNTKRNKETSRTTNVQ